MVTPIGSTKTWGTSYLPVDIPHRMKGRAPLGKPSNGRNSREADLT
jgi:hypothetical protein